MKEKSTLTVVLEVEKKCGSFYGIFVCVCEIRNRRSCTILPTLQSVMDTVSVTSDYNWYCVCDIRLQEVMYYPFNTTVCNGYCVCEIRLQEVMYYPSNTTVLSLIHI